MLTSLVSLQQENDKNSEKSMKIINIKEKILNDLIKFQKICGL